MSYEDTIKALKIVSTVTLGQFAGSSLHVALSIQPALIEQEDVPTSSKVMRSILRRSFFMPLCAIVNSASSLALYFKTRGTVVEDKFWLCSGSLMLLTFPYTISLIGPINIQYKENEEFNDDDSKWNDLLRDWLTFHYPRAILSFSLFAVGVYKITYGS